MAFATKATEIVASPADTTTLPGASGLVRGVPETDDEAVPAPWAFTALTNTVYDVPLLSEGVPTEDAFEMVSGEVTADAVRHVEPSVEYS